MQTLHASIDIAAPAALVWDIVTDFDRYPEWNPFIVRAAGLQRVGERLDIAIQAPGTRAVRFRPRVLELQPGRLIRWKGQLWIPGLFDGRHALVVEERPDGASRFTTHEEVTGVLLPVLGKVMCASQEGFEQMAEALRRRAEGDAA